MASTLRHRCPQADSTPDEWSIVKGLSEDAKKTGQYSYISGKLLHYGAIPVMDYTR